MPMPEVGVLHGCAHIPARKIVNHLIAIGIGVDIYRSGYEENWLWKYGQYEYTFTEEVRASMKALLREDSNLPKDTMVCLGKYGQMDTRHITL